MPKQDLKVLRLCILNRFKQEIYSTNVKYFKMLEMVQKTNYTNNKSTAPLDNERALSKRSMSATDADPVKLRRQLVEKYHQLLPPEQVIVQLFSVIYEPVSRAAFALCLNQTGTRDKNGKPFTQQTLKPYIEQLLAAGLLVQNSSQGPQCNSLLVEIATRDAVQRGGFESLVQVVQEKLPLPMRGKGGPRYFSSEGQLLREVRIGIYRQDIKFINQQLEKGFINKTLSSLESSSTTIVPKATQH